MPRRRLTRETPKADAPVVALSPEQVLDGPRPTQPAEDEAWRAARRALGAAAHQHPQFDPRIGFHLEGAALRRWREDYRGWAVAVLAGGRP